MRILKKKIAELENDFISFIQYGRLILNCTRAEIRKNFPKNRITILPGLDSNELMEIRFEDRTLSCLFNNNNTCYSGFLFLDNLEFLDIYKKICNNLCRIVVSDVWRYDNYYIELRSHKADFYFAFCLQYNSYDNLSH